MIRLSRVGKKKQPQYRLVVSEKSKDPWGDNLEILGFYDPLTDPKTFEFKKDRILHWISNGAQPSDTVHNLLVKAGVIDAKKKRATKGDIKKRLDTAKEAEAKEKEAKEKEAEAAKAESEAEAPAEDGDAPEAAPEAEAPAVDEKKEKEKEKKEEAPAEAEEKKESTDTADKEEEKKE